MKDYISSLVRQTINEFYSQEDQKPHILVLITNTRNKNDTIKHIESLADRYRISLLISKKDEEFAALRNIGEIYYVDDLEEAHVRKFSRTIDLVYCPVISRDFLAKLSLLLDNSQSVWFVLEMFMEGKEVLIGTDSIMRSKYIQFWKTSYVEKKVQLYMKELRKNGVQICTMKQAATKIRKIFHDLPNKKPILFAKQIEEAAEIGLKEIKIPKNCVITPMAIDVARELQIEIKEDTNEGKRDDL